ncbi:hypothetical protein DL98DRAFT_596984 [Cadophora sp. DSE1049]|nr:hypothetical protein DL98DRAFT_596984 [Cadophora sp. DSE1049]
MGRNNVRGGEGLLLRAGNSMEIPSVIPEFNDMPIVIIGYNFAQDDLDQHVSLIRYGHNGAWAQLLSSVPKTLGESPEQPKIAYGPADQRYTIPKIHISQGMNDFQRSRRYLPQETEQDNLKQPDLAYILVVQGSSGMFRSKLVLRTNLQMAGAEMFHEAVNGFSVVFTGAVLKTNLKKRGDLDYSFKKAGSLDELVAFDADESQKVIGVLC